ncbi:MAG TPA: DUF4215 domain-containing protein, partial [Labilithrix sp.]|nr:DUF4215 domain-containing protein [Labilithrix sp.]
MLSALASGVASCEDRPPAADSTAPATLTQCTEAGCSCTPGTQVACGEKIRGDLNFIYCYEGTRTCDSTGVFGNCNNGNIQVRSVTTLSGGTAGIEPLGLGATTACTGTNPCDPYCSVTTDTPTDFDAGPAFGLKDGGVIVMGCGDGELASIEECDDGNNNNGDGCSSTCRFEIGYQCPTPGAPCTPTTCGDGLKQGAEQCDDGNTRPYDGCSPSCSLEPSCPGGACIAICGDGLIFPGEACDDGNIRDGDGCSSTCTVETGATCETETTSLPPSIDVPVIYRDFKPGDGSNNTHKDFENQCCGVALGMVNATLAADGKPTLANGLGFITNATTFYDWFHDGPKAKTVVGTLNLAKQPDDSYQFISYAFFPLNN